MKTIVTLLLLAVLWEGDVTDDVFAVKKPIALGHFRIVYNSDGYYIERQLINVDKMGIETQYWYQLDTDNMNNTDVWRQAFIDKARGK